jgi:hypothetical protein
MRSHLQSTRHLADNWRFVRHVDSTWSWMTVERDRVSGSFRHFGTLSDAVADALQHGFERGASVITEVQHERRSRPRHGSRSRGS